MAVRFGGSILNGDSLQVYRRLDIGTAKPTMEERSVRPHFLFDVAGPGESVTAGDFRRLAIEILERELPVRPVFVVGGSGFYMRALEKGMYPGDKPDPLIEGQIREEVAAMGPAAAWEELRRLDPGRAAELHPHDVYRVTRALITIRISGGKPASELARAFLPDPPPWPLIKIGLDIRRADLAPRIARRTQSMLQAGMLEETKLLIDEGFAAWPALDSVGYRQCRRVLDGHLDLSQLAPEINLRTLQLAKKQQTWFRRDPEIVWFNPNVDLSARVATYLGDRLAAAEPLA